MTTKRIPDLVLRNGALVREEPTPPPLPELSAADERANRDEVAAEVVDHLVDVRGLERGDAEALVSRHRDRIEVLSSRVGVSVRLRAVNGAALSRSMLPYFASGLESEAWREAEERRARENPPPRLTAADYEARSRQDPMYRSSYAL
jgi:hypothetical protein